MGNKNDKERIKQINTMLLEMAEGNFFYRLERTGKNDNIEAMVAILNMLAEEIQESHPYGITKTKGKTKHIVQMVFKLNAQGIIRMTSQKTCILLHYLYSDIIGQPFEKFLARSSKNKWFTELKGLMDKKISDRNIELVLVTKDNLRLPNPCHITTCEDSITGERHILITIVHHTTRQHELEEELKKSIIDLNQAPELDKIGPINKKGSFRLNTDDVRKIRKGREFIMNNLEKDLPGIKELALHIGTNEYKLKMGFKSLYGTTVYRFILEERLAKTKILIQYTDLSLKSIALKNGFKSFPHFSRSFKKKYGYSPSELRKQALKEWL